MVLVSREKKNTLIEKYEESFYLKKGVYKELFLNYKQVLCYDAFDGARKNLFIN